MPNLPAMPAKEFAGESTSNQPWIRNITYGIGDARNWMRKAFIRMLPSGGRSAVISTDRDLHTGSAPWRVARTLTDKSHGFVSGHTNVFPFDGNFAYIPHLNIVRDAGTARSLRTFDDGAQIAAVYAGAPQ